MANEKATPADVSKAALNKGSNTLGGVSGKGLFTVECRDKEGNLKWVSESENLVVNVGLADMNTQYFKGSGYTAAWHVGIYGPSSTNNPAATDTMAAHTGWVEVTDYTNATRPVATFGDATTADPSLIANSAAPAQFLIDASANVGGAFLTTGDLPGGTTGTLFSASDFAAPGDRVVQDGDVLSVTYTFSLAAT